MASAGLGKLLVIGGGGHAWVVSEAARAQGWRVMGFFDDDPRAVVDEQTPRLGAIPDSMAAREGEADDQPARTIIALGSIEVRARLIRELGGLFATVVHPLSHVSPSSTVGDGTFISATAVVQGRSTIGGHGIINTGAIVEHDCTLGRNVHIAPRAVLGGGVRVGDDSLIGLGASVRPGIRIGSGCIVGVGAAVIRDVKDGEKVVGVPARPVEWWTEGDSG
ncbi:MAG: acetyltransferase [Phycisphaerae bacterium]|nr:acetyltransferase [Phycisphaerae bacterium]